jgi:hypothetical protein
LRKRIGVGLGASGACTGMGFLPPASKASG